MLYEPFDLNRIEKKRNLNASRFSKWGGLLPPKVAAMDIGHRPIFL